MGRASARPYSTVAVGERHRLPPSALENYDQAFRDFEPYAALLGAEVDIDEVGTILDVGGGNGAFVDRLLAKYPAAQAWLVDDAPQMIARNVPHDRKQTMCASVFDLELRLPEPRFDLITVNVLLHHLVDDSPMETRERVVECLALLRDRLQTGGVMAIYEQFYDSFVPGIDPGELIFGITRLRAAAPLLRALGFATAGIGVAFRSRRGWLELFAEAGLRVSVEQTLHLDRLRLSRLGLGAYPIGAHLWLLRPA
ncbi:MAG: class I SAM-dependent methyltransferase [Myxococcales bacterium FL481]|nr:MAG: class I SAM-dependent methyltransferase [Myxococcales bacterium FL481]